MQYALYVFVVRGKQEHALREVERKVEDDADEIEK